MPNNNKKYNGKFFMASLFIFLLKMKLFIKINLNHKKINNFINFLFINNFFFSKSIINNDFLSV